MANVSFSLNRGQSAFAVLEGADGPLTGDLEISINMSNFANASGGPVNNEIMTLLEMVMQHISGKSKTIF